MAFGSIYLLTNKLDGMKYVGQTTRTVEERFKEHEWCKTSHIGNAIRKYGKNNFTKEILEECENQEQLNEREIFWIAHFNCRYPNGYNHTEGGEGGWERTPESIAKMSRKGKKHSDKTKIELSLNSAGRPGRSLTDEEKAHLSEVAPNKRKVICVETGTIYDSVSEAARCHNVKLQSIQRVCKGKRKMTAGFHWKYADELDESTEDKQIIVGTNKKRRVICVETDEEFKSIQAAARHYGVNRVTINRACKNPEKIAAGHHWKFVETTDETTEIEIVPVKKSLEKTTRQRRVMCLETGEIFESMTAAARCHPLTSANSISRACKETSRTAGGYHWLFVNKPQS